MLAKRIALLRGEHGLSQQVLADRLELSQRTVAAWEAGARRPSYDALCALADLFDVTTDYLLGRTEVPNIYTQCEIAKVPPEVPPEASPALEAYVRRIVEDMLDKQRRER